MGQGFDEARLHWAENEFAVASFPLAKHYNNQQRTELMIFFSLIWS